MRAPFAWLIVVSVAGCFTPDLGDGSVVCGVNGMCPPKYYCHAADQRCHRTPDVGGVVDMSMSEDGSGGPDLMSTDLANADLAKCNKAACGNRNCGTILDGCGGVESCGMPCMAPQTCGGGNPGTRMPNVCNSGPGCTGKTCVADQDCGLISDGCSKVLDCGMCSAGKTCGTDNMCH